MSRFWSSHLTDLALAGAVTLLLPAIAFLTWPFIKDRLVSPPEGAVLIYEVVPDASAGNAAPGLRRLINAMDRRVNADAEKSARIQALDDRQIEVAVMRPGDVEARRIEQLLKRTAALEFHVLANTGRDRALIERATADPTKKRILDKDGKLLAWWVPVKPGGERELADYSDVARRTQKRGKSEITEVLVVEDGYGLTGAHLKRAQTGVDYRSRPTLVLKFNKNGGDLFRQLTGSHLPEKAANRYYKLAVILNGELISAPVIVSTIYNYAEIAGCFSNKREVDDLVTTLNSGGLPARIRLVEKKDAP